MVLNLELLKKKGFCYNPLPCTCASITSPATDNPSLAPEGQSSPQQVVWEQNFSKGKSNDKPADNNVVPVIMSFSVRPFQFPFAEMGISLQFIDIVSPVKLSFLSPLLDSFIFSVPCYQMTSCEPSWSYFELLKIQAFSILYFYFIFFLAIPDNPGSPFLKGNLTRYHF